MKNVVYGCLCAFLLALTWLAIDTRTAVLNIDMRTEQIASGVYILTRQAAVSTATQNLYWKATSLQTSRLIGGARHSVDQLNTLLEQTNGSLNDKDRGLLPTLAFEIHQNGRAVNQAVANADANLNGSEGDPGLLPIATKQVLEAGARTDAVLDEAGKAAHEVEQTAAESRSQIVGMTKSGNAILGSSAHVADHYDHVLTDKQTTWQKVKAAIWFPIKVAIRVW